MNQDIYTSAKTILSLFAYCSGILLFIRTSSVSSFFFFIFLSFWLELKQNANESLLPGKFRVILKEEKRGHLKRDQ